MREALGWAPAVQSCPDPPSSGQALQSLCSYPFHRMAIRDLRAHSRARAELGLGVFFLSFLTHSLFSHHSPAPLPSEEAPGQGWAGRRLRGQRPGGLHHGCLQMC